jgi:serine/threonine protein kinase
MSPEQIKGLKIDERSDIYSLGVVLYELVTGNIPFNSTSEYDLSRMQIETKPILPRQIVSKLPEEMEGAILRALDKNPAARFQTVREFRQVIESSLLQLSIDTNYIEPYAREKRVVVSTVPDQSTGSLITQSPISDETNAPIWRKQRELLPVWTTLLFALVAVLAVVLIRYRPESLRTEDKSVDALPAQTIEQKVEQKEEQASVEEKAQEIASDNVTAPVIPKVRNVRPPLEVKENRSPDIKPVTKPIKVIPSVPKLEAEKRTPADNPVTARKEPEKVTSSIPTRTVSQARYSRREDVNPIRSRMTSEFLNAAWNGDKRTMEDLLDQGVNVNARDSMGRTALMLAASKGHGGAAKFLIKRGANVNARDINGKTALIRAIEGGHDDTAKALQKNME